MGRSLEKFGLSGRRTESIDRHGGSSCPIADSRSAQDGSENIQVNLLVDRRRGEKAAVNSKIKRMLMKDRKEAIVVTMVLFLLSWLSLLYRYYA